MTIMSKQVCILDTEKLISVKLNDTEGSCINFDLNTVIQPLLRSLFTYYSRSQINKTLLTIFNLKFARLKDTYLKKKVRHAITWRRRRHLCKQIMIKLSLISYWS